MEPNISSLQSAARKRNGPGGTTANNALNYLKFPTSVLDSPSTEFNRLDEAQVDTFSSLSATSLGRSNAFHLVQAQQAQPYQPPCLATPVTAPLPESSADYTPARPPIMSTSKKPFFAPLTLKKLRRWRLQRGLKTRICAALAILGFLFILMLVVQLNSTSGAVDSRGKGTNFAFVMDYANPAEDAKEAYRKGTKGSLIKGKRPMSGLKGTLRTTASAAPTSTTTKAPSTIAPTEPPSSTSTTTDITKTATTAPPALRLTSPPQPTVETQQPVKPSPLRSIDVAAVDATRSSWVVLVQHEGAVQRLTAERNGRCVNFDLAGYLKRLSLDVKAVSTGPSNAKIVPERRHACVLPHVSPAQLPSWTLQYTPPHCESCTDPGLYAVATRGVKLQPRHGAFASVTAPLGRIGPMLYAMSSVTDDVDVRAELPKWSWLRHVHPSLHKHFAPRAEPTATATTVEDVYGDGSNNEFDAPAEATGTKPSYVAVMGIPSTDQAARVALRTAQRRTWMTYSEVARAGNNFNGALLPLYLFAAVEPDTLKAQDMRPFHPAQMTPSYAEYASATELFLEAEKTAGKLSTTAGADAEADVDAVAAHNTTVASSTLATRRVQLRADWRESNTMGTPCMRLQAEASTTSNALTYLSAALDLPVTPAYVSPAAFICHASAGLWQEALTHRNVVWIDMMTDRKPTTKKVLGDTAKWGLPVEVGMSQKLILWLSYAYHAFPDVPFILKGDDDAYVKVPQFMSDIRFVRSGAAQRVTAPFGVPQEKLFSNAASDAGPSAVTPTTTTATTLPPSATTTTDEEDVGAAAQPQVAGADSEPGVTPTQVTEPSPSPEDLPECVYWGSMRGFHAVMFNAGMTFMAHRKLIGSVLMPVGEQLDDIDIVALAAKDFDRRNQKAYRAARLHQEDILLGLRIAAAKLHAEKVCPGGRTWYINEGLSRFHDMHRGKMHDVTWSTVVAHRCTPADTYFLHYYFQQEHLINRRRLLTETPGVASDPSADGEETNLAQLEVAAAEQAALWAEAQAAAITPGVVGWDALPSVRWTHVVENVPVYEVYSQDKVAVYHNRYVFWNNSRFNVDYGYLSLPRFDEDQY